MSTTVDESSATLSPSATTPSAPAAARPAATGARPAADPLEIHDLPTTIDKIAAGALEKATHPLSHLVRSLVGGVMVAFGVLLSLSVSTGITTPGLASLAMGLTFGFSFVIILVSGMSLITADMAAGGISVLRRELSIPIYLRFLGIGLVGNLIGSLLFISVAAAAGGPYLTKPFAARALAIGTAKSGESTLSAILLAVLCTWFLQTAMVLFFKARTDIARISLAFYGPFAFVIGGTQHVIANIGFIGMPWLLHAFHPDAAPATAITWGLGEHGILRNLIATTAGNFIGGAILVAAPLYLITRLQARGR